MSDRYSIREGIFHHITLEGVPYDIGRRQADIVHATNTSLHNVVMSETVHPERYGYASFKQLQAEYERACPGINEEIQGFADGLEMPVEQMAFYEISHLVHTHCSQMVVLPSLTDDGHMLAGRSYEWKPEEEDLRLCTTQVTGKARHIGFSCALFGRMDGMNEHGLSLTMSGGMAAGEPHEWHHKTGLNFWVVQRGILDDCRDVQDALAMLRACPPAGNTNIVIGERRGKAALVEIYAGEMQVKEIDRFSEVPYLVSTNHYILPGMIERNRHQYILDSSLPRAEAICAHIERDRPHVTRTTFREVLTKEDPHGCRGHYYTSGFGTLWSMIFDLSLGEVEICFGAPGYNPWHTLTLDSASEFQEYVAQFPDNHL